MSTPMPDYGLTFNSSFTTALQVDTKSADKIAERFLKQQISDPNYKHELNAAQIWALKKDGSFHLVAVHPDVYELLNDQYNFSTYVGVLVHTTGWAAPLDENGEVSTAPSKHEMRRRVALASCVTNDSVGSALSFADEKDIVLDPGSATGSLADALLSFWENNSIGL